MLAEELGMIQNLSILDWCLFALTIFITFLSAIFGFIKDKYKPIDSWAEHILMGRKLTLPLFVATLVATWYGDILGVTQTSFNHGIYTFLTQGLFWYITYILFSIFLAKRIRQTKALTFPQILKDLLGDKPGYFAAILIFFKTLPIAYVLGMGIFLQTIFNIPFYLATFFGLLFVILYSLFGGFKAVVYSDVIQMIFMYLGIISVVIFSYRQFGGLDYLQANCPKSHFSLSSTFSFLDTIVWFFIAMTTTFLNPTFYQRCLAANSDRVATLGIFVSMGFWFIFDIATNLIGLYARAHMPSQNPINASLIYSLNVLPFGLKGLFLGGVLATILSTLDSFLFISSTVLSYDLKLIKFKSKNLSHITSLLITGIITFFLALSYEGNFEKTFRFIKGIFASCLFLPIIICLFRPKIITGKHFSYIGLIVILSSLLWEIFKPYNLDTFYIGQAMAFSYVFMLYILTTKPLLKNRSGFL